MMSPSLSGLAALVSGGGLIAAASDAVNTGFDYKGVAAIIAASAGMVTAISALILGLRSKSNGKDDAEVRAQVLEELLIEQLKKDKEKDD